MTISRRALLEAGTVLAALAPLSRADAKTLPADAVDQAAAVAGGKVTSGALIEAAIRRLALVNPELNAVALPNFDRARAAAGRAAGPLGGVPTLIKDNIEQAGLPWTSGCRALQRRVGKVDSGIAQAVERAGLVSIGRSTLPEFALLPTSEALSTGPTRNPWNLRHSSGGSSGGSAAAVAAGVVAVAHGNDGGGSIRIPASCCNLVGLKPSRARMAGEERARKVTDFGVNGCLSRTVRDTAAWFAACEARGPDAAYPPVGLVTGPSARRLRVSLQRASATGIEPHSEVAAVFEATRAMLAKLGHSVADGKPAFDGAAVATAFDALWSAGAAGRLKVAADFLGHAPDATEVEPLTLSWAARGTSVGEAGIARAVAALQTLERQYAAQFEAFDVLMTPTLGLPPVAIGTLSPRRSYDELAPLLQRYVVYTPIENAAGAPAIGLPMGFTRGGLPVGMQFTTRPGGERVLLELAYELENAVGWHRMRPKVWAA